MDTRMVNEVIAMDRITARKFTGVFVPNELPKKIEKFPCGIIANTDPNYKPGEHWIAFYLPSPNRGEFFDSYGNPQVFSIETLRLSSSNRMNLTNNGKNFLID